MTEGYNHVFWTSEKKLHTKSGLPWERLVGIGRQLHLQGFSDKSLQNEKNNGYQDCFNEVYVKAKNKHLNPICIIMPFQKLGDAGNGRQLHLNSSGEDYLDFYEAEAFYDEVTTHAHQNLTCMGFVSICEGYGILEQLVNCFPAVLAGIS